MALFERKPMFHVPSHPPRRRKARFGFVNKPLPIVTAQQIAAAVKPHMAIRKLFAELRRDAEPGSDRSPPFQPEPITIAFQPDQSMRELIEPEMEYGSYIGRPYAIWRDHPEIARMVNDRLVEKKSH